MTLRESLLELLAELDLDAEAERRRAKLYDRDGLRHTAGRCVGTAIGIEQAVVRMRGVLGREDAE